MYFTGQKLGKTKESSFIALEHKTCTMGTVGLSPTVHRLRIIDHFGCNAEEVSPWR